MSEEKSSNSSVDPLTPDLTPASNLDPAELLRRVTARVAALWRMEAGIERERRRVDTGGRTYTPGGRSCRR
jgi:hypothetical protein